MSETDQSPPAGGPIPPPPPAQPAPGNPRAQPGRLPPSAAAPAPGADTPRMVKIGGVEHPEQTVADALAERVERDVRRAALPRDPQGYQPTLPEAFKPPEGMEFQLNADDPALKQFRDIAHRRGLDQETFSEALGAYASIKVAEHQQMTTAREAELNKLGAAADTRIDQVATWLTAKVGDKAGVMIATLKQFPVAANVEALEGIIRAFTSQGSGNYTQGGREGEADKGKIAGYESMSFEQRRHAQEQVRMRGDPTRGRGR
jgi:hypothetical protein